MNIRRLLKKNFYGLTGGRHFWERVLERKIPEHMIRDTIKFGEIHTADKGRKMFRYKEIYIIFSQEDKKLITINTWADTFEEVKILSMELKHKLINNIKQTQKIIDQNKFEKYFDSHDKVA